MSNLLVRPNKQLESPLRGWDGVAAAPQHGRYRPMKILALFITFMGSVPVFACTTTYFESINLKAIPVLPFREISSQEAARRESEGEGYFINTACAEKNSLTIVHRQDKADLNVFDYKIELGKVVSYSITNSEGEVISGVP